MLSMAMAYVLQQYTDEPDVDGLDISHAVSPANDFLFAAMNNHSAASYAWKGDTVTSCKYLL